MSSAPSGEVPQGQHDRSVQLARNRIVTASRSSASNRPHALAYAARGWFVVPVHEVVDGRCTCQRRWCRNVGKHPIARLAPNGSKDASRWDIQVGHWWDLKPNANIGIVTGPSGLVVLDVDPRNGGDESLDRLVDQIGGLPQTLTAATGGGGHHYVFADPDRVAHKHVLAPGLDVIAGNCYILAAPSTHWSGERYRWLDSDCAVANAPGILLGIAP